MTAQKFNIDKLRVATPCPVTWDTMEGDDLKRFCDMCSLNVYNISEMTRAEAIELMSNAEGRICGKIYRRADGTVITKDCPVGLRAYRKRIAIFAGAALSMVLGLFSVGYSQCKMKGDNKTIAASELNIEKISEANGQSALTGVISDSSGEIIRDAEICLYDPKSKKQIKTRTNRDGKYRLEGLRTGTYILKIKYVGFKILTVKELQIELGFTNTLNAVLEVTNVYVTVGTLSN